MGTSCWAVMISVLAGRRLIIIAVILSLDINKDLLPSILSQDEIDGLLQTYLSNMKSNYDTWMINTIKQEQEDWQAESDPEIDMDGCYYTSTPVLLNRMMEENIMVSSTISDSLIERTFSLSVEQLIVFGQMFRRTIEEFREMKESRMTDTIKREVTTANNCGKFLDLAEVMRIILSCGEILILM